MKKIIVIALSVLIAPVATAQTIYKQKTFVFSETESIEGDHFNECMNGIDFISMRYNYHDINPNFAYKSKISSVETWDMTGKVTDHDKNRIGEILICQDWQTYFPEQLVVPVYYEITIGGKKYRAAGAGTSPNVPQYNILPGGGAPLSPDGYPEFGVSNLSYSATVFPSIDGKIGGMFHIGNLGFVDGRPREYYNHFGTGILQITVPFQTDGIDGKDWLQPYYFRGYSYEQIAAVCSRDTGLCSGTLPGNTIDLTGYRWASVSDVEGLFVSYGAEPPFTEPFPSSPGGEAEEKFCRDFLPTYSSPGREEDVIGYLRGSSSDSDGYNRAQVLCGAFFLISSSGPGDASPLIGAWFWRPED